MSIVDHDPTERFASPSTSLQNLLSNHLILLHTTPYLTARDRLALGATCNDFYNLIHCSPGVFRHLDLSVVKTSRSNLSIDIRREAWPNVQADENVTEDEYYAQPLRRIFAALQRRDLLSDVQTLVLDGMSVTAELCNEIITDPTYNVRLLSIRGAKNLNEHKLRAALKYACRPTRPTGMPKLKGLYLFTDPSRDASEDPWYDVKGKIIHQQVPSEWADTLVDCQGIIAFDAVLCAGPRHLNSPAADMIASPGPPWAVATVALPGCAGCGTAPEGTTVFHPSADRTRLPLLPGAPLQSSSLKAATCPELETPSFIARCTPCLDDRRCATCEVWWCEACYTVPFFAVAAFENGAKKIHRSCVECGYSCNECISHTQKRCTGCGGGYCIVHNEGSSSTLCDCAFFTLTPSNAPAVTARNTNSVAGCSTRRRRAAATRRPQASLATKSQQAWADWMRTQNSIGERRAREGNFPRESLRCLAARS